MKYMGSKRRIAKDILPIILKDKEKYDYYVEPFCGGCNIIDKVDGIARIANDNNKYLIAMWQYLVYSNIEFPTHISKESYSFYRDIYNKRKSIDMTSDDAMIGWVGWMGSFNGRFFDGGYSGHNVNGRDYITEQMNNTLSQVEYLKGVEFVSGDYEKMVIPEKSIIYCDIPYKGTKQYSTSRDFDYERFYKWCIEQSRQGNKVFVSEYSMPKDFVCIWQKEITNAMGTHNTYKPTEKLFTINID